MAKAQGQRDVEFVNDVDQIVSNRLNTAEERLSRAVDRLDRALKNQPSANDFAADLSVQMQALQAENTELRALVNSTAQRLDGTIAQFKSKLAG